MTDRYLTKKELLEIPERELPLLVVSENPASLIATAIKMKDGGGYNHLMWLCDPGKLASQNLLFQTVALEKFTGHRLKFWTNNNWNHLQRATIREVIRYDLSKPWWRRRYDLVAIFGQWINCNAIQIPWLDICSDKAKYLKMVDDKYNLQHPSPQDVNEWLGEAEQYLRGYRVWARYVPD